MKKVNLFLASIILLSACASPEVSAPSGCAPGSYDEELDSGGQTRTYRLHIPAAASTGQALPLLIGFHGAGSTGPQFEGYTGFSALADRLGFLAAYPQGLGDLSNWDSMPNSTDVPFVSDLIDQITARCKVDPARIYAAGHSRGGGMANRLGCELADRIAAIAPVAGDYEFGETCSPSRPMPVVSFHGTADPVLPYNGFGVPGEIHESYLRIGTPIPAWAAAWGDRDGCEPKPEMVFQFGPVMGQGWSGCQGSAEVILYTIEAGTHDWPSAVDAAQMIWDFFARHPLDKTLER